MTLVDVQNVGKGVKLTCDEDVKKDTGMITDDDEDQPIAQMYKDELVYRIFGRDAWKKLGNMDPDVAMEKYVTRSSCRESSWMVTRLKLLLYY
ncbi:FERM/acyl-CoA-binding protein [Tanacetum coccineum]